MGTRISRSLTPISRKRLAQILCEFVRNGRLDEGQRRAWYRTDYPILRDAFGKARTEEQFRLLVRRVGKTWMKRNQPAHDPTFEHILYRVARKGARLERLSPYKRRSILASKVLHFSQPERYPIWDSFLARKFRVTAPYGMNRYRDWISAATTVDEQLVNAVHRKYQKLVGYKVSTLRAVEAAIYDT
jgi:hypothetical protein